VSKARKGLVVKGQTDCFIDSQQQESSTRQDTLRMWVTFRRNLDADLVEW
jgi:hypothetical protein